MALPYDTKTIPYYGRSTSESGGGGIIFYNIIDRPCGIAATTRMNNTHPHQQQQQQNRLRYMEDFNEFVSQGINDVEDSLNNNNNNNNYPLLSNIDRSPIRSNINRAQSARHYGEVNHSNNTHHHHPSYIENSNGGIQDDTAATMMLMIRNGTLKPQAKRSRRTVSAPQIPPFDSTFNDNNDTNNNDLLDLFDIDDDNQIRLTSSENDYNSSYSTMNHQSNSKAIRSQSHDEAYFSSTLNDRSITATTTAAAAAAPTATTITSSSLTRHGREYPFYSYIDHSQEVDMTPDVPLTAMGRVPTFLAKLHAILLRPELQHIVAWLPHGRSWKVYQAVEFEKQVIAVYFEFTKHPNSSFFRQAKLWGFLRIKQTGMDHDSYYHPRFVRGLPHLCKDVRRPPASHLPDVPPVGQEPNLTMISEIHPVPPSSNAILHDPTIHLDWFMKGKQQQQSKTSSTFRYPPPIKEGMAKKTSSSTSASTDFSSTHSIVKRKRSTQEENKDRRSEVYQNHHTTEYDIEPIEINVPSRYDIPNRLDDIININIDDDDDDDEPPIDDDLGLNLDPYFSKGYHLYPFYDYIDYSSNMDMYPLQPYTDIGQEPTFPMLLHAMLLWQQQQSTTTSESSIQWQPHGRAWRICSVAKFEAEILPMFFVTQHVGPNDTNHTAGSFFRHVTRWGFKRIDQPQPSQPSTNHKPTNSSDIGCYYHPKFLRGLPHLCKDWNMNDATSASSLSTSPLISEDDEYNHTSNNQGSDPNHNEYPEPDFTKISQLHPVPNYDPNATVEDLLGCDWFLR